ncbi:glycoside hydrolase family 2 protein [Candidatus Latescibacterota bacterium]
MNATRKYKFIFSAVLSIVFLIAGTIQATPGRYEQTLSGPGWKLWLDHNAVWANDDVYMPPVDVSVLPVNPPTCGWGKLDGKTDKVVDVPGTVEQHYWGAIGGAIPDVGGDYRGVSWWSRSFSLPASQRGKRVTIAFTAVNLRAEVFVNRKFVGYDVIGNSPFEIDITDAVNVGGENRLDVRITDPVGNFSWNDNILMRWGKNLVPAVHGFGGITGKVVLKVTDTVHVDDIYVQNKPKPREVEVFVTLGNTANADINGKLTLLIHELGSPANILWKKTVTCKVPVDGKALSLYVKAPKAKLWEFPGHRKLKMANMYEAKVVFESGDGTVRDTALQRFGFRWFDVRTKNGDPRFYLNGKRTFIMAAMTRGFWPVNGMFATDEMAKKDLEACIDLGYNMMLYHRAIGQPHSMDYCDLYGLFSYEEPGGYRLAPNKQDNIEGPDEQAFVWRREKLRRMMIRDRSRPSLLIYNLKNEARNAPDDDDERNMRMMYELDPSRITTYNSDRNRDVGATDFLEKDPYKMHFLPFDPTLRYHGWWDQHHWFSNAGHVDDNYNNPRFYLRHSIVRGDSLPKVPHDELIFWGEEGAFGTMVRIGKIKDRLKVTGAHGFREMEHLDWFETYDRFLDDTGFRSAYPTVDNLTLSLGRNMHYFHGRSIENVRMSNFADAYVLNGWGSGSTRTDIVDMYRNPTADPSILQYYTQPLYVAVKIRDKVLPAGDAPVADIFVINEVNLRGKHTLELDFVNSSDRKLFTKSYPVTITGGETFGELLVENVILPPVSAGYSTLNARITLGGVVKATGFDDVFAVDCSNSAGPGGKIAVIETDGAVAGYLNAARGISVASYTVGMGGLDCIIVGAHEFDDDIAREVCEQAASGVKLIVLVNADKWAEVVNAVSGSKPPTYQGEGIIRFGSLGRHFVGHSPFLRDLPQAQGMNWEYQTFYHTRNVSGLRIHPWGVDTIVAMGGQHTKDLLTSLCRIGLGEGEVFLSTLDIVSRLSSEKPQAVVAKKLLLNLIEVE